MKTWLRHRVPDGDYFRSKVAINTLDDPGCWEWLGGHFRDGYGVASRNNRAYGAHRFAYQLLVGEIPAGLELDHLCRNRSCVNPNHLEPVSKRENVIRGVSPPATNAAKTHCSRGHLFSEENTSINKNGGRFCRTCHSSNYGRLTPEQKTTLLAKRKIYYQDRGKILERARKAAK